MKLIFMCDIYIQCNFGKNMNKEMKLTLCLSMCKGLKFGSKSKRCGSKLTGDCRRPLLHSDHSGFMSPQNAGPAKINHT